MIKDNIVFLKDKFLSPEEAKISILSPTSQYGLNVFEGIRCYMSKETLNLYAFRLNDHIDRLYNSASSINLVPNYTKLDVVKYFKEVVLKNSFKSDIIVRLFFYVEDHGSWGKNYDVNLFISPISKERAYEDKSSMELYLSSIERINEKSMSPKIKTGANYMNSRLAHIEAVENKFDTALLLDNNGFISESTGSTIFLVKNNKLFTPSLDSSILDSITRKSIIELADKLHNIETIQKKITKEELYDADEIFLCGTAIEVFPVQRVCDNHYPVGSVTKLILESFFSVVRGNNNYFQKWLTKI